MQVRDCKSGDIVNYNGEVLWIRPGVGALAACYKSREDYDAQRNTGFIRKSAEVVLEADGNQYD